MTEFYIIILIMFLVALSAFFSGTETGIYRLSRFRLRLGIEQHRPLYHLLDKLMADSQGLILSILIGNNLVTYLATGLMTLFFLVHARTSASAEFYATLVMAPVLFVFGELIPKNIFFYLADSIMPRIALLVYIIHKFFTCTGLIPAMKFISSCFARLVRTPVPQYRPGSVAQRHYVRQIIHDTREEGVLSAIQLDIIERLINIPAVQLGTIMIPLAKVTMLPVNSTRADLLQLIAREHYRNIPVYASSHTGMIGYINIYEVLNSDRNFTDLKSFLKPIVAQSPTASVIETLNRMRNEHLDIILVAQPDRTPPTPLGIVTIKDLVEELIGEFAQW